MYKLMIKTHNVTGLKYLCITKNEDHDKYTGSGRLWKEHLNQYGKDVTTEVIMETNDIEELHTNGLKYSAEYDVVESDEWANLIPESGYTTNFEKTWFKWYNSLSEDEKRKRNRNISKHVKARLKKIDKKLLGEEISRRRLSLSSEAKDKRKRKIQDVYKTGKHDALFERYSKERQGGNNPSAKSIIVDGVKYGSVQEASRMTGIADHVLYRLRRKQNEDC